MSYAPLGAGLGLVIVIVLWAALAFILYLIVRFGVKHGMRSYYAEARCGENPPE